MISSPVSVGLHTRQLRFWLLGKFWKQKSRSDELEG
ncbi:hypothetical protein SLEP1_g54256 [Rubroshorea leprosula]|uniref:Uncharacterized protein n=1 Tax=Rubroshorea leprosula TaxID=152421 RepID=A0AAV5MBU1_9ROSI|nr:hypothetical protein SLEP1_g54256 [Rubroshorea leprosula]